MNAPRVEVELDGQRQPIPGHITRLTVQEVWEWGQTPDGEWAPEHMTREAMIRLTGPSAVMSGLDRVARRDLLPVYILRPGCPPARFLVNLTMPSMIEHRRTGAIIEHRLELHCRARGEDLAREHEA